MASAWRKNIDHWAPPSPPPLLDEAAPKPSKRSHFSRRSTRAKSQARQQAQHLELEREKGFRLVRHGSDPLLNDSFYATQVQVGNFVKMGWLTKQGHMWKSWKTRFFVLFSDGTFAYYKNKGRKKIKGCMQLNDGVVSVQHVDIRVAEKAYVFQIEKGFYKLLCYCCSQFEAELWVAALRSVRRVAPPCYEMDLTVTEEKAGSNAVTRHLNKIFITDKQVAKSLVEFKENDHDHSYAAIHNFIVELDDAIIDRHHLELYQDPEIELLPGNELVRLIRRHVEDRVFIPLYAEAYTSLETDKVKARRSNLEKNMKVLKQKTQADFGISKDLSICNWKQGISVINMLDCVSLPTHKFEVILSAGKAITEAIAQYNGELFEVSDEALTAVFRYVVTMSSLRDLPILRALLKYGYQHHPACQNKANIVTAFLDAIKWIECFETGDESYQFDSMALAGSRISVSISTNDVGIQFTTDGNGRGAIVYNVRKLSQAALSAAIVPGLSLIAINHEPVIGMPFDKIIQRVRTAALPKQLTFMTEFYYYQLLTLDSEMFQYLMCIAARRGDLDSAAWLRSSTMELNTLCSWEKSRGKQVFGFIPVSGKGSPLHAAVHNGQLGMVNYLISKGVDTNLCNHKGRRPLHVVKQSMDMALIIQSLTDAGADIDATERHGLTPLMFMCSRSSLEGSATLLALGADVRRVAWSNGFSALEFAVKSEHTELVELCLSKGANPNAPTLDGSTSLHLAAAVAHTDIILRLLQGGANPNIQNRYGQTPATVLLASASCGKGDARILCLEILTCAGCRLDKRDLFGRQASHLVSISREYRVVGLLQKLGSLNRGGNGIDVDIFGYSSVDYTHRIESNKTAGYLGLQTPNKLWEIADKNDHTLRSLRSRSIEDLIHEMLAGMEMDFVDVVAFVLFLDSFSSLNEVVDQLSEHVRNGVKNHGLIRLFIMILLFRQSETTGAEDLCDRFYSLISHNIDVSKEQLVPLINEYTSLHREYFSLRGAGDYAVSYETIPGIMSKMYGLDVDIGHVSNEPFPTNLHRYIDAEQWAEQCTLLTHALFCKIPVQDFISISSKKQHSVEFTSAKRWFQHISAYVINAVLVQNTPEERAEVISFYLKLSVDAKKKMNEMQLLSDKGCREMNRLMRITANPSMPYIGLYLQSFVGLNELPVFNKEGLVNTSRLRRMGELAMEILHRQSVAYSLQNDENVDKLLHVSLPYYSEESRYTRSLELEPREADAMPLSDRGSCVVVDEDLDLENEVRESIGSDGRFGFRQWIRKQQVVHRNRSRSSLIALYEWV
ncbi:Ras-specific guanine nucleotide-releasing factor [Phytophthora palmivora]|uniref:Ras-specific guanine nucleotide-releasing factor n=1 Tax=Phytophthora palmivora TaxID=4796 RepID=A0A2P4WYS1_9STRA|nr:Ras-specific guanine nucleotide-releasing factor [Phytophthora palmivora]